MPDDLHHVHAQQGEVELLRVPGRITAEPILAALRANGIPCRLQGEALGSVYGLTLDGLGEVAILVPAGHAAAATALLDAGAAGDLAVPPDQDPPADPV
jgi:hypothetical protein